MNTPKKQKRIYKRITPQTIAKHKAAMLQTGNGTAAVEIVEPEYIAAKDRAYKIARKGEKENITDYIENTMQQIGEHAIIRVGELVNSVDERVATKNAHFVIDHIRGKAVQRQEGKHLNINIEAVLD